MANEAGPGIAAELGSAAAQESALVRIEARANAQGTMAGDAVPLGVTADTVGVEEEVMLLNPADFSLSQSGEKVLRRLSGELYAHSSPETHASVIELVTGIHEDVAGDTGIDRPRSAIRIDSSQDVDEDAQ